MPQSDAKPLPLEPKYQRFVAAMLTASTLTQACRKCKISDDSGRRWLAIPEVKQALDAASSEMFNQDLGRLKRMIGSALDTLQSALTDEFPNGVKVRAAAIILAKSIEINEISELKTRLADLENKLQERGIDNGIRRIK